MSEKFLSGTIKPKQTNYKQNNAILIQLPVQFITILSIKEIKDYVEFYTFMQILEKCKEQIFKKKNEENRDTSAYVFMQTWFGTIVDYVFWFSIDSS